MSTRAIWTIPAVVAVVAVITTCVPALSIAQGRLKQTALVIGNVKYKAVISLRNSGNDADLIAKTLKNVGFTLVGGKGAARPNPSRVYDRCPAIRD